LKYPVTVGPLLALDARREEQALLARCCVGLEVLLDEGDEVGWDRHIPNPGLRLWRFDTDVPLDEDHAAPHLDHPGPAAAYMSQLDVLAAKLGDLAVAECTPGGQQDHELPLVRHVLDDGVELFESGGLQPAPLRAVTSAADVYRAGLDQVVVDGRIHDRPQQPIRLRDGPRVLGVAVLGLVIPMPHGGLSNVPEPHVPERRHQVKLERGHARRRGRGPRRLALVGAALGDPLRGVGLEVGDPLGRSSLLGAELRGRPLLRLDQLALLMGTAFGVDLLAQRGRRQVAQDVGSDLPSLFATRSKFRIDRTHRSRGPGIIRPLLRDVRWSGN
jgi:hypothetical protein